MEDRDIKMREEIKNTFVPGTMQSRGQVKANLQKIYDKYEVRSNAKASDLTLFGVGYRESTMRDPRDKSTVHIFRF